MSPFQPLGDQPRWKIIYDLVSPRGVNDVITYEELGEALGLDPADERHQIQMAVRRAAKLNEERNSRVLEAMPNVGYRVIEPTEHMRLAKQHQRKSHKALARGHSKVVHVDLNGLDADTRKAFEVVAQAFAMQMDFNRRMDVRQQRLETAVADIAERHERSAEEAAELRTRLERLERQLPPPPNS